MPCTVFPAKWMEYVYSCERSISPMAGVRLTIPSTPTRNMSSLESLPDELLLMICAFIQDEASLSALAQSSRHLYAICDPYLYQWNVRQNDQSALFWAANHGCLTTFKKAIDAGAFVPLETDIKDHRSHPLIIAAKEGHEAIARFILDRGVSPNIKDSSGFTPILQATAFCHTSVVRLLLERGARQIHPEFPGYSPLSLSAYQGDQDMIGILLSNLQANGDDISDSIEHALLAAVMWKRAPIVKLLIIHAVDLNFDYDSGHTLLMTAAENGDEATVSLLLDHGADPNKSRSPGRHVPLTHAAMKNHEKIARILVGRTQKTFRTRALAVALRQRNIPLARMLLDNGTPPEYPISDVPTFSGATDPEEWMQPLVVAVERGDLDGVRLLLEYHANIDVQCTYWIPSASDAQYDRVLFRAIEKEDEAMVCLLVENGANLKRVDMHNKSPLHYANLSGNEVIIELLKGETGALQVDP